jgi:hypothetical protein
MKNEFAYRFQECAKLRCVQDASDQAITQSEKPRNPVSGLQSGISFKIPDGTDRTATLLFKIE